MILYIYHYTILAIIIHLESGSLDDDDDDDDGDDDDDDDHDDDDIFIRSCAKENHGTAVAN